jgi:hypothetical protein
MLIPQERAALIAKLRSLPDQVEALTRDLTADQLTSHYLPDEWSVAQNVHHLFDSHVNSYIRCKLILTEDNPPLKPYDQDAWAALPDGSNADISHSLALLRNLHWRWVQFWDALPEAAWARTGVHPEVGVINLEAILRSYAAHGESHLDQMQQTLAAETSG